MKNFSKEEKIFLTKYFHDKIEKLKEVFDLEQAEKDFQLIGNNDNAFFKDNFFKSIDRLAEIYYGVIYDETEEGFLNINMILNEHKKNNHLTLEK